MGICEIELGMNCTAAVDLYEFEGDCCTVKEMEGECFMVTTSDCYYQVKGATGCTTDEDGNTACVVPGTQWSAVSNETCPESEFEIPMNVTDMEEEPEDEGEEEEPEDEVKGEAKDEEEASEESAAARLLFGSFTAGSILVALQFM